MLWLKKYKPEEFDDSAMNQSIHEAGTKVKKNNNFQFIALGGTRLFFVFSLISFLLDAQCAAKV